MLFVHKLVALAITCTLLVPSSALNDRFLSVSRPDDITLNYNGVATSDGTSQIIVLDSGAGN